MWTRGEAEKIGTKEMAKAVGLGLLIPAKWPRYDSGTTGI